MARVRTVELLPEIFRTPANTQFLNATLDQLTQEPKFKRSQGYIGQRVGPGVDPQDKYVVSPDKTRADYQLEPGVVSLDPNNTRKILDAITYPGINDAIAEQGGTVNNPDRLYNSDYYTWDPFCDFDKLINYSQYYWLPNGPLPVTVSALTVLKEETFRVYRTPEGYAFTGENGTTVFGKNPVLNLARTGTYNFIVAQNNSQTIYYKVTNREQEGYVIDQQLNPTMTLIRGNTYVFNFSLAAILDKSFFIKTEPGVGITNLWNRGVTNNGNTAKDQTVIFSVPLDAPDTLYYSSATLTNFQGTFDIVDPAEPGPKFWIQQKPGVLGVLPYAPNISSRDVYGVSGNGTDFGTIEFQVPTQMDQSFYYDLVEVPGVDLVCDIPFDQVQGQLVSELLAQYGGIDEITNINGRSMIFIDQTDYDVTTTVWNANYVTQPNGDVTINLVPGYVVNAFEKFTILFGDKYAATDWYKTELGAFQRIPLLTALDDVLYYQDSENPDFFGTINLIDQPEDTVTLNILDILGHKTYISPNGVQFSNGMIVTFKGPTFPATYQNNSYVVAGVGTAIQLLPTSDFITPEVDRGIPVGYDSVPYDSSKFDELIPYATTADYLTINPASPDKNPWSRSNRWVHIDVINQSAKYNNTTQVVNNELRAKRPIIEFRAGIRLFNYGTKGLDPVNVIDFTTVNAMKSVAGKTGYGVDGYKFLPGNRVIFANDQDPVVRSHVYRVDYILPDPYLSITPIIDLVQEEAITVNDTVVCLNGLTQQGKTYWFDGVEWIFGQQKTKINQAPLFEVYDSAKVSFADKVKYPSSTFKGCKLFSYAVGTSGTIDVVLGFPLKYSTLSNLGDIIFDNNFYTDTFLYVSNKVGITTDVSEGFVYEYAQNGVDYVREIGWQRGITESIVRQQFQFVYDGKPLQLDVAVANNQEVPAVQIYVNSKFILSNKYKVEVSTTSTKITLNDRVAVTDDVIEVLVISPQVSSQGFYQVPVNLQNNPFNLNSPEFTLGTARSHYQTICQNLINLQGTIDGPNNTRDLGNIVPYGLQILQQSAPMTLAGFFMRSEQYDIFSALEYNSREYNKFKSQMLQMSISKEYGDLSIPDILDSIITDLTLGRTNASPFYWSDMVPTGAATTLTTVVNPLTGNTFNTTHVYDFTSANFQAVLVYVNNVLLTKGSEYTVSTDAPTITILVPLKVGDTVVIKEYNNTAGNYVPNTPTKMGLYAKYKPELYLDTTYITPQLVIRGHDGSITIAFDDYRTEILLEFEKRIYNNLKTDGNPIPLTTDEVIPGFFTSRTLNVAPGFFRTTDYTSEETNNILNESFLAWVGANKLDYKTQDYIQNNTFTYNYSLSEDKLENAPLPGAWRGIYRYFFDCETPNLTPWEMLGFSEMPAWWQGRYGPAPYTSGNMVLWDDLEAGYVADPKNPRIIPEYIRPGLSKVIPVGSMGELLSPYYSVMGAFDPGSFKRSWDVNAGSPVEYAWWKSSSYPFAAMRLLALTRPAQFFSLFADRDLYRYDPEFGQYLYNGRYRLDGARLELYGNGVSKASYINWIIDYNRQLGIDSTTLLSDSLKNLDVRLCYRMAGFSDKTYMKISCERSSPGSQNASFAIPPESYNLLLYKNQPFESLTYSAVIVEVVENGYAVYGYSNIQPFFEIYASNPAGIHKTVSAGGASVNVPVEYTRNIVRVPYATVFRNTTSVVDFLLSYGAYLADKGLSFDVSENGYIVDWTQMSREFLYFAQQGWAPGTVINLNAAASQLTATRPGAIVDTILSLSPENMVLNQYRAVLPTRDMLVERVDNTFRLSAPAGQTISFIQLKFTSYEHMIVLDNSSEYEDLIYDPVTAARQSRLLFNGYVSSDWNGTLDAQGFVLNQNNVQQWRANQKYAKGEIVLYKNVYWSAQTIVQPKELFDYNDWVKSDYTKIQIGLLPNISNQADQLANSYDTQVANLDPDDNLFAYGLIGYRPREYMAALNLDNETQVQLYQQFLGSKGTLRAAEIFTRAELGNNTGEYTIYENWAILAATYGAQANRKFFELRLNEALLRANPALIQLVYPQEKSRADQAIPFEKVWQSSFNVTSPYILPTKYLSTKDTALPSAGYVNANDVDITVFSLNDPSSIEASIDKVGIGTVIWVAKTNSYDWGIYRCEPVKGRMIELANNLNKTSIATFNTAHGLKAGDLIIIKFFSDAVNGVYRVISVPSITSIVIAFDMGNTNQTTIKGLGIVFYLQTMRVKQASDIASLPYANSLLSGARAWVDDNGDGHWKVLEKQEPFAASELLTEAAQIEGSRFGACVAQAFNNTAAIVGAPGFGAYPGSITTFRRGADNEYFDNGALTLPAKDVSGFGNSASFGNLDWAIVGAERSNSGAGYASIIFQVPASIGYNNVQLLVAPDQDFAAIAFGSSVVMSENERWAYVAARDANKVYAYGRTDIQAQFVKELADGKKRSFSYANDIIVDPLFPEQIVVQVNNVVQEYGIDYQIVKNSVVFVKAPIEGQLVYIARRQAAILNKTVYHNLTPDAQTGTGTGATFTVVNQRGEYRATLDTGGTGYRVGDTLTISYAQIDPTGSSANDLTITVDAATPQGEIYGYTESGTGTATQASFILNEKLFTATNIYSFRVQVDGQVYRANIDYTFDDVTTELTFTSVSFPGVGANIQIVSSTYWRYAGLMNPQGLPADAAFGASIQTNDDGSAIVVGAPLDNGTRSRTGAVYVYDRSVIRYSVTNAAQRTYNIVGTYSNPVNVFVNNQFVVNSYQTLNGAYTVDTDNNTIVFNSDYVLNIGDVIEIDTNDFNLVQKISTQTAPDEAAYGAAVDINTLGSQIFVGAPLDGKVLVQGGTVDHLTNQAAEYGITTSTTANPVLSGGDNIRINDTIVTVPDAPNNNIEGLASAIQAANIPNVTVTLSSNLVLSTNGTSKVYNVGSIYSSAKAYNTVVYIDETLQRYGIDYTYDNSDQNLYFVVAPPLYSKITVVSGRITVSVINNNAAIDGEKLSVLPGTTGDAFASIGFDTFVLTQNIVSPYTVPYAHFGQSLSISNDDRTLVIGAPNGYVYEENTFDNGNTIFDENSTTFFSPVNNSGVVYSYDLLASSSNSITDPAQFVFGQQIYQEGIEPNDEFGYSVEYTSGKLLVGAPGRSLGYVSVYKNLSDAAAWFPIHEQQPVVDIRLLNSVFMFDRILNNNQTYLDFFDPLQGTVLGVARRNIDYTGAVDPANYNNGVVHNNGNVWGQSHVGEIWWDTDTVRFIDPNQDDIIYASRRWGQLFPGSRVDIYQWQASTVPPVSYTGPGTPFSLTSYTEQTRLTEENIFVTEYYFWVRGVTTVATGIGKTLAPSTIANYITNPRSTGIAYLAPLNARTVAIYNCDGLLSAEDTILHVNFSQEYNDDNIHNEYELIADGRDTDFLNDRLYRKLQDSLCGADTFGNNVPDPFLTPAEKYGVEFRPRQSMFADRFGALKNYLTRANEVLINYPISETRSFYLLNSAEPIPSSTSGEWDKEVANLEELSYQNLLDVPVDYRYLVVNDSDQDGRWAIYTVIQTAAGVKSLRLTRVQIYDTPLYWSYVNWYKPGYNKSSQVLATVPNQASLKNLSTKLVPVGGSAEVASNGNNKYEIYQRTATGWDRVVLQDGTIQFKEELWNYQAGNFGYDVEVFDSQYYDQEPTIETRQIIRAINEELFVDDLLIERNKSLILMFNYVFTEFTAPDWLTKTSLIDVNHKVGGLVPYQVYQGNNQDFILQYIQEVKPYHVQVREFNLNYTGEDAYPGNLTDFDCPSFFDLTQDPPAYISPVLTPYKLTTGATVPGGVYNADTAPNAAIWEVDPWQEWFGNYLPGIQSVTVLDGGQGYTAQTIVSVAGDTANAAVLKLVLDQAGSITAVQVINPGSYKTTPTIVLQGGSGTGARFYVNLDNPLTRSISTNMRYDRCEYASNVLTWEANELYPNGTLVRYRNVVWKADGAGGYVQNAIFDPTQWDQVAAGDLSAADRTIGYYVPTASMPGVSLPLLIDGVEYPGVQVWGEPYVDTPGYGVGPYDKYPYDGDQESDQGYASMDAIYASSYLDIYLGTRPTDVNVDGGKFIDVASSYAPEELVPGSTYDTLDMKIYTRTGQDQTGQGWGFPLALKDYVYRAAEPTTSYLNLVEVTVIVTMSNITTGTFLTLDVDYTVDYVNSTVTVLASPNVTDGDELNITVYGLGGGNQLFKKNYTGAQLVDNSILIPVRYAEITEIAAFVDGVNTTAVTTEPQGNSTLVIFESSYSADQQITIAALGEMAPTSLTQPTASWSTAQQQIINVTSVQASYTLTNNMGDLNPVTAIINVNGKRAQTAPGAQYVIVDQLPQRYDLPRRIGISLQSVLETEVLVYLDQEPLTFDQDFILLAYDPVTDSRAIELLVTVAAGQELSIYVTTSVQAYITGNQLFFVSGAGMVPVVGDTITVISWNDTTEQNLLTQEYVGPVTVDGVISNSLVLARPVINPDRLWVTLNGSQLFNDINFKIEDGEIYLANTLSANDTVIVTYMTDYVAPDAYGYCIFQDMLGTQLFYMITPQSTTELAEPLAQLDEVMTVKNARAMPLPDLSKNIWGVVTVNGERIMYRELDLVNNTASGLLRGTAGTAAANHTVDSAVFNLGRGNLLPVADQNYVVSYEQYGNGKQTIYTAYDINL